MLVTETTQCEPTNTDTSTGMSDTDLQQHLAVFEAAMRDGLVCNFPYLWKTAVDLQQQLEIKGDAFIVALAIASLTKIPRYGTRATHAQIARRASAIRQYFVIADQVGEARIMSALGIGE
jgi:hypothetical protein